MIGTVNTGGVVDGSVRSRKVMAAFAVGLVGLTACASRGADALGGGDVGGSYASPVVLGGTLTYGAAVLHARGHVVTLRAAELVPYRGSYSGVQVRTAVVGPRRGGAIVDSAFGFPGDMSSALAQPVNGTRVEPPTGNGPDFGVELLFGLTPDNYGDYRYRSVRVTYDVEGRTYTRDLPAAFRLCVVKRLRAGRCPSEDLLNDGQ